MENFYIPHGTTFSILYTTITRYPVLYLEIYKDGLILDFEQKYNNNCRIYLTNNINKPILLAGINKKNGVFYLFDGFEWVNYNDYIKENE